MKFGLSQNKAMFISHIDKIEKAYLKAVKIALPSILLNHFKEGFPQKVDLFKVLKNKSNDTGFVFSNDLLNKVKQIADLIDLRARYPDNYISDILFKLDDLLAFIVHGYYSTDFQSYSERLLEFFDLVITFDKVIKGQIHDILYWEGSKAMDYVETKQDLFNMTRDMLHRIYLSNSCDDFQTFQSEYYKEIYFTIRIVKNNLQILFREEFSKEHRAELIKASKIAKELNIEYKKHFYEFAEEFNDKKYEFKLNFKKVFNDNIEQEEWYKQFLSKFYFSFESVDFPDSVDAMRKMKTLTQTFVSLDQFFSKISDNKQLLMEEIIRRIDENSGIDYILDKEYLNLLNNEELQQLLLPLIQLLKTYSKEFLENENPKFYSFRDKLLKNYFSLWSREKILETYGLRFDGYYHNFFYKTSYRKRKSGKHTEVKFQINTDLKFYDDGTIKFGEAPDRFEKEYTAQGRYIVSSDTISFFLNDQRRGSPYYSIAVYEGVVNENSIDISKLFGSLRVSLPNGLYQFIPC